MTRKKPKSKEGRPKMVGVVDCRSGSSGEVKMEEPSFISFVQNKNLVCCNLQSFTAAVLAHSPGSDVWWPAVDPKPGAKFSIHETVFVDDPSKEVWQAWKREQERIHKLLKELTAEEEDAKQKQRQQEQAAEGKGKGKPSAKGRGKGKAPATELSVSYTDLRTDESFCTPVSIFCRSVTDDVVCFNFAAYRELYVVDDKGKPEHSSTTPRLWHADQEWEEFLTEEPIFMEERRPIHGMFLGKKDGEEELADDEPVEKEHGADAQGLASASGTKDVEEELEEEQPGQLDLTSAGRKDEQHAAEHSGAQGLASTSVEEELEEEHLTSLPSHAGRKDAGKQLREQPAAEHSGGPKLAAGGIEEALTLLQDKGGKATTKQLCVAMCSIVTELFRSIAETNTRLTETNTRLDDLDSRLHDWFGQHDFRLEALRKSMRHLNDAVSLIIERSSRSSLWTLFQSLTPGARVLQPVTNKVLPYQSIAQLERLAELCSQPSLYGCKMRPHRTPQFAEIDVLLKVVQEGSNVDETDSPEVGRVNTTTVDESIDRPFHHIAIGEVTRSRNLCASASDYSHPRVLSNTPSTKLLYKFIQLERGMQAAMAYYAISLDSIQGGVIVSPSFMESSKPKKLIAKVLHHSPPLVAVRELHKRGRIWLVDI